jgi:hypothetical protein
MIAPKSLLMTAVVAIAVIACTAPSARARVADQFMGARVGSAPLVEVQPSGRGVPPRVDGIGRGASRAPKVVAVPVTRPSSHAASAWLLAAVVAVALTSLTLLGLALWSMRPSARSARRDPRAA